MLLNRVWLSSWPSADGPASGPSAGGQLPVHLGMSTGGASISLNHMHLAYAWCHVHALTADCIVCSQAVAAAARARAAAAAVAAAKDAAAAALPEPAARPQAGPLGPLSCPCRPRCAAGGPSAACQPPHSLPISALPRPLPMPLLMPLPRGRIPPFCLHLRPMHVRRAVHPKKLVCGYSLTSVPVRSTRSEDHVDMLFVC